MDALVAELDDRLDHLLFSSASRMPCCPPTFDEDSSSWVVITSCAWSPAPSIRDTPGRDRREDVDERSEDAQQDLDQPAQAERKRIRVGEGEALGHELAEDDREEAQDEGHDDQREGAGGRHAGWR